MMPSENVWEICAAECWSERLCVCVWANAAERGKVVYRPAVSCLLVSQWPKSSNKKNKGNEREKKKRWNERGKEKKARERGMRKHN